MNIFSLRQPAGHWISCCAFLLLLLAPGAPLLAAPAVVINEVHYHPVELPAFNLDGSPVLDLSDDVHEFVELFNAGPTNVSLAGWRLTGEIDYDFALTNVIVAGKYLVIARNPARLRAISVYALNATNVLGPYAKQLSNRGGVVRLQDAADETVDSVSYSAQFPWAIGADALGAEDEWTGLVATNFQYRGRSLERVSSTWPANDPANWVASPAPGNPTPSRANSTTRTVPRPVVIAFAAYQNSTGSGIIRANQSVRIDCTFSATNQLSAVSVEYFVDDINSTSEARTTLAMSVVGATDEGRFTALLPGRPDRNLVRYRIRANRGGGVETVSPRADDPFAWHAWFVTPVRTSTNRIYDCFISSASLTALQANIVENSPTGERRVVPPDPPGLPRASWNANEPAVFVYNGEVFDARARYHGSQYRRAAANNSWKWQFPKYQPFDDREGIFISDNTDETVVCHALVRAAGLPSSYTRWIDYYLNGEPVIIRMDQDEMDDSLSDRFAAELARANPGIPKESVGEFYKSQGVFFWGDPTGPFGYGGFQRLPARPPFWTERDRYDYTFGLQMHGWKGSSELMPMLLGLWAARGDSPTAVNPNLPNLRAFLSANFDVDAVLTHIALRVWMASWDNFNHNHFIWRRANGKWAALPWDFDEDLGGIAPQASTPPETASIYLSEFGVTPLYFGFDATWINANWINDSFFKAFREEYKQKLFTLNHTLLNPTNITALGFGTYRTFADARFASINSQVGLGAFTRPAQPTNVSPFNAFAALPPASLQVAPYAHSTNPAPAHASTTWFIRSVSGSYTVPVFKTTSTSNLTSLPVPFDALTFGETYYWRCIHTDTNGHPSAPSAETRFVYGADPTLAPLISLDAETLWRYNQGGTNLLSTWRTLAFNDSSWPEGAALLADDTGPLPEPIRTTLTRASKITFYFRKKFTFTGNTTNALLRLRPVVDDGVLIYLNGAEILRIGMPVSAIGNATRATRNIANATYEGPFIVFPTNLISGTNVLAAEVHRNTPTSADVVFGLTLEASVSAMPGHILINEILADNRASAENAGQHPDFIELYNNTSVPQNLNGFSLSDNVNRPGKFIFPPDTVIEPFSHYVVWCDDATNAPGLHTGFALDNDGQTVALFTITTNGYALSDTVTFGLQVTDLSVGRTPDGPGAWQLNFPTPGTPNFSHPVAPPGNLRINEWMATDAAGPDWFEIYNPDNEPVALGGLFVTDKLSEPANTAIAPLSFIGPGAFRQFIADQDLEAGARHVNFKLSGNGESIGLYNSTYVAIDTITFGPQLSGVSEGRLPDGALNIVSFPTTASPEEPNYLPLPNLVINEVLSHSDGVLEDAVELFNTTAQAVNIGGWWLSDAKFGLRKFQIPANTQVPAGGFLVLYENQFNSDTNSPLSFSFSSAHGDAVYLSAAEANGDLTGHRTEAHFDAAESGVSVGRFQTSQGEVFVALSDLTFGADTPATLEAFRTGTGKTNSTAKVGPVVISEILFHPPDLTDGGDNARDEFIELRNLTAGPVPLFDPAASTNTWRLRDAVDFRFPTNVTLAAGEAVLVVSFDPVNDTNSLAGFLDTYGAMSTRLFGPYGGKLDNSSDSVELVKPDAPVTEPGPDLGFVPAVLVDKVKYLDRFPWPTGADGTSASLMRQTLAAYGNDPTNWFAWVPTPGGENIYNQLPLVSLTAPADGTVFPGQTNILLTADASDLDGTVASVDFFDGTTKVGQAITSPFQFLWTTPAFGLRTLTARARDNGNAASVSAPVTIRVLSQPPVVVLTGPTNDALFRTTNTVSLAASATDSDTPVSQIEFYVDGAKVGEDLTPAYTATWPAVAGSHALTAVATDSSGVSSTSAVVNIFVQTVVSNSTVLVGASSTWRFLDTGVNLGTGWTNLNFNEVVWGTGAAELGYGDGDETTTINFGSDTANKYITYYFRQKFVVTSIVDVTSATLSVLRDDGALAYLNGAEVYRDNLPAGAVNNLTTALVALNPPEEATFYPTNVTLSRLVAGTNILAVEVHQQNGGSSDVSFAAELRITRLLLGPAIVAQPRGLAVQVGETAAFVVAATSATPLSYQWRFNGGVLAGRTNATLTLTNAQLAQTGNYTVTVANSAGLATSVVARLTVVTQGADTDGDGIPNDWEIAHGLDPLNALDGILDRDGDGLSNKGEYLAGTDPNNASSVLRINALSFGPAVRIDFAADANIGYVVQYADDPAGQWADLQSVIARPTNRTESVADPIATTGRFFRLSASAPGPNTLKLDPLSLLPRAATISFHATSNKTYTVLFTDLLGVGSWTRLADVPARATNHTATLTDPRPAATRVYRLVTPQQP